MRSSRAAVAAALLAAALSAAVAPRRARADPPPAPAVRLSWTRAEGGESCPDQTALAREVTRRLGRDPFAAPAPGTMRAIEGVVSREQSRWVARFYVRGADGALVGSREIASEVPTCASLGGAVAFAIALAIDPEAAMRIAAAPSPAPSPRPVTQPPPRTAVSPPPAPRAAWVTPPRSHDPLRPRGSVTARALGAFGLLPRPAAGVAVATTLGPPGRWHAHLGVLYLPEVAANDARFAFGLTAASAAACVDVVYHPRVELALCLGGYLGALHAVVSAPQPTQPGDNAWGAAVGTARVGVRLVPWLLLEAGVDGVVPVYQYRFYVEGPTGTVFQAFPVAAVVYGGAGVRFW